MNVRQLIQQLLELPNLDSDIVLFNATTVEENVFDVGSLAEITESGGKYYVIDGITELNDSEAVIAFEAPVPSDVDADDELDSDEG